MGAIHPKVVFLSATGWLGGPSRSLATVLRHRHKPEWSVLASPPGELPDLVRAQGTAGEFVSLFRHPRWRRISRLVTGIKVSIWLVRHHETVRAVHANGLSELNAIGLGALLTRTPVVVWSHASRTSPIAGRMASLWARWLPSVQWAAVSDIASQALRSTARLSEETVKMIPNPIELPEAVPSPSQRSGLRIGYFSQASESKGFWVLLETAKILLDLRIEWWLFTHLIPESPAWNAATAIRTLRVKGRVQDVGPAYQECDIVFCPSLSESFGRIAAEAMAHGLPVVASDIAAFRNLIGEDEAGLLFPPRDSLSAARAIRRLVADQPLRVRLGETGKRQAARLSPSLIVPRLERMYGTK